MAKGTDNLPEILEHDFVICDESINRYGWRLLVGGIDIDGFSKNPVCVVQHNTSEVSIGRWKNVRVEGDKLQGTLEFDKNDEIAVMYYLKYKNGYMNAVSLHVIPVEESDDKALLLPGQKYPTLTKSELLEVSLVTIPGNKNAVKLCNPDGSEYKLNLITKSDTNKTGMDKQEQTVADLTAKLEAANKLNADNLIALHKQRGVVVDGEMESLKRLALLDYESTSKMLDARVQPQTSANTGTDTLENKAKELVKLHFERGVVTATEQSIWERSAMLDFEGTKKALEAKVGKETVTSFVQNANTGTSNNDDSRKDWTYLDYYKKDHKALMLMQKDEPEKYKKLELAWVESNKEGFEV